MSSATDGGRTGPGAALDGVAGGIRIVELSAGFGDDELPQFLTSGLGTYKLPKSVGRSSEPHRDDAGKVRRGTFRAARVVGR